jgi:hypothetical protein
MLRILAIRQKFIDAQSHFVTTSQLLSIASAQPLDAKEADQSRKAANKLETLRRSSPVAERGGGGGGRHSLTEVEVYASPSPAPAGEVSASSPVLPPLPPPAGEGRGEGSCPSGPTSQPSSHPGQPTPHCLRIVQILAQHAPRTHARHADISVFVTPSPAEPIRPPSPAARTTAHRNHQRRGQPAPLGSSPRQATRGW